MEKSLDGICAVYHIMHLNKKSLRKWKWEYNNGLIECRPPKDLSWDKNGNCENCEGHNRDCKQYIPLYPASQLIQTPHYQASH